MIFKRKNSTPAEPQEKKPGFFSRLKSGLSKTSAGLTDLLLGAKHIDDDFLEELNDTLLMADVGIEATEQLTANLHKQISRKTVNDSNAVMQALEQQMTAMLAPVEKPLSIHNEQAPYIILMVGINGAGKTTTIGKLAHRFKAEGKSVMLAAGDTFRAAAVEQLQTWGKRNDVPVIAQSGTADSAAVIYDAIQSAKARQIDVLIADTAGRLHTQSNLMEELKKVVRVIQKAKADAPNEIMLVLDASIGQNALQQAKQFHQAVGVTGITITKLDGTAKGGIIFSIANSLQLPIRFVGVGETVDDLQVFNASAFVHALLGTEKT
jgi:fused signal recognition particle receptor